MVTTTVEEWVEVEDAAPATTAERFVSGVPLEHVSGIATYGPFRVTDGTHAALVGITDDRSPAQFAAMLRDYPQLATLDVVECPGTFDDIANLELGRMIRQAGITTHVPKGGSVRSGAVELFIAGAEPPDRRRRALRGPCHGKTTAGRPGERLCADRPGESQVPRLTIATWA